MSKHGTRNVIDQTVAVINPTGGTVTSILPNISGYSSTAVATPYLDVRQTGGLAVCSVDTVDTNATGAFTIPSAATVTTETITAHGYKTGLAGTIGGTFSGAADNTISSNQITATAHGFVTGEPVTITGSTLPTGLVLATTYYLIVVDANTLSFATTNANALADTVHAISGGTGTINIVPSTVYIKVNSANSVSFATTYANAVAGTVFGVQGITGGQTSSFVPTALAGCSVVGQWSLDTVTWNNIGSATSITTTSTFTLTQDRPFWPYFRLYFVLTAGSLTVATTYYTYTDGGGAV